MKQILLFLLVLLPVCAFAQFKETFEGTEIPECWKGARDSFCINENGQLQMDASGRSGKSTLATPILYSKNMKWSFTVSLSFNPSNSNHARIYIYRTGKPNDILFFVQIGHNDDNVSLYMWEGETPKLVITGRKKILDIDWSSVEVCVTMDTNQKWALYSRLSNESGFTKEGEFERLNLPNLVSRENLSLECRYQAKSKKNVLFCFDNIEVTNDITPPDLTADNPEEPIPDNPDFPETQAPKLLSLEEENSKELLLTFDQVIEPEEYSFQLNGKEADEVYISEDNKVMKLAWQEERKKGKSYSLVYSGIFNKVGIECKGSSSFISKTGTNDEEEIPITPPPTSYTPGSLLINEIMADPKGLTTLPETEYVELYNASTTSIQVKDWSFLYGDKVTILDELVLPAGKYLLLYREGRNIAIDEGGFKMPLAKFPSALANAGKDLKLQDPSGVPIDAFTYEKAKPGLSWERTGNKWHLSSDIRGGTPGSVNSVETTKPDPAEPDEPDEPEKPSEPDTPKDPEKPQPPITPDSPAISPGEIIFNELLPNPFTDGSEYIELYNRSERQLYLSGLSIATRKADGNLSTHYPLSSISSVLETGGYALLTKSIEGVTPFYLISSPEALHELKLPILANASSTLVLFRTKDEIVIDEVSYTSKWHATSIKNEKGVSLERINPDGITQDASNWTSASETAGFGTPGYRNSQKEQIEKPDNVTSIEPPVYVEPTGSYIISYWLEGSGYNCRIWIYNTAGRRVAEIANHELLGTSGELQWNGMGSDGKKLSPGPYIFYAELYHTSGSVKRYKKVFLAR